jgi:hypothetical protein
MRTISLISSLVVLHASACVINPSDDDTSDTAAGTSATTGPTGGGADETSAASAGAESGDTTGAGLTANERCGALCEQLVAPGCDNGLTTEGCLLTCESLTSSEACDPSASEYMDCVDAAEVTCNAAGDPAAPECGLAYLVAIGCAVTENPNPALVDPCAEYCGNIEDAMCPASGTVDECNTNCLWLGNTGTGCDEEWTAYVSCFNQANVSCLIGFAVAEGCGPDFDAYWACVNGPA